MTILIMIMIMIMIIVMIIIFIFYDIQTKLNLVVVSSTLPQGINSFETILLGSHLEQLRSNHLLNSYTALAKDQIDSYTALVEDQLEQPKLTTNNCPGLVKYRLHNSRSKKRNQMSQDE